MLFWFCDRKWVGGAVLFCEGWCEGGGWVKSGRRWPWFFEEPWKLGDFIEFAGFMELIWVWFCPFSGMKTEFEVICPFATLCIAVFSFLFCTKLCCCGGELFCLFLFCCLILGMLRVCGPFLLKFEVEFGVWDPEAGAGFRVWKDWVRVGAGLVLSDLKIRVKFEKNLRNQPRFFLGFFTGPASWW